MANTTPNTNPTVFPVMGSTSTSGATPAVISTTPAPNTANQPSPVLPVAPVKPKAKGEKAKEFVVVHMGVGEFVRGDKVDASDLFSGQPDTFDYAKGVERLIELGAIEPNAE